MRWAFLWLGFFSTLGSLQAAESPAAVEHLRCEYRVNPLGIDVARPRLSWEVHDARRGAKQTAYRVLVAGSAAKLADGEGDLWDSGKVVSDQSTQVVYAGKPLQSRARCYWKVRIWDRDGRPSAYGEPAPWTMGLLTPEDVKGRWIGLNRPMIHPAKGDVPNDGSHVLGCALFRKEFRVGKPVVRATVYASALGIYRLYIDGKPVGNDYFTPDWTDYDKRVYYNAYDVSELVHPAGPSAIAAVLSAGWYSGAIGFKSERNHFGTDPRLFVQLEIELADGTIRTVATDGSWKTTFGPHVEAEFLAGETYDARMEMPGWTRPGFDDTAWQPVAVSDSIPAKLQAFPGVTVQETGTVRPVGISEHKPGVFIFDMGQNFAGVARLKVKGETGAKVVMRFAEMLNPDGSVYTTNLRTARATDTYIIKGGGAEIWQPRFTYHGFRYVELTGNPGKPNKETITGIVLNSNTPLVGSFECSSPMVNRLYRNIVWTQRANFISVPTDCPQRDERMGWLGDAELFMPAAVYSADVGGFFTKWLVDVEDAQGPEGAFSDVAPRVVALGRGVAAWADAGVICPWIVHQVYGDKRIIERHYGSMVRWIEHCRRHSKGLLRPAHGYGDWLAIKAATPKDVLATAYFAHSTRLVAKAARLLGREDDAKKYDALFQQIKEAFNKAYVSADGRIKGNTQTCYVLALAFDLLPEDKRGAAARHLVEDIKARGTHLSTGTVGTSNLMTVLSATGHNQLAYRLLLSDTFPSWGYPIKHGATTVWERWDGWTAEKGFQDPGMNSFSHYALGSVGRWLFQTVAGIDTDGTGFKRIIIRPQPAEGLTWVKANYRSIHGPIASAWKIDSGRITLDVTVPANTTATVYVPTTGPGKVTEGGRPAESAEGVELLRTVPGARVFRVSSGAYRFVATWQAT